MASGKRFLAFDLGAESGRGVLGTIADGKMELSDVHRFPNGAVAVGERLYWDLLRLFTEIKSTIGQASREHGVDGIGVSTWGIDFSMFDARGDLVGPPHCYRDPQTTGVMEQVFKTVPKEEVFEETGIQFMPINALYHLYAYSHRAADRLGIVRNVLNTPDAFNYWLSGEQRAEVTIASTTQYFRGKDGRFATEMLENLGLPTDIFPETIQPATKLGLLSESVAREIGSDRPPVIAVAGHDTACAMAAVPYIEPGAAAISCGTWSSIGVEVEEQCRTDLALANNFTNEVGAGNVFMFRKNMMGLWSLQECRRVWSQSGNDYSYAQLAEMAAAEKGGPIIEPDFVEFLLPGDMPRKISDFCSKTSQPVPESPGAVARAIFDGMALKYRFLVDQIDEMLDRKTDTVHLVGGGSRNELLCQLTANALGRRVIAGPAEATAMGNVMLQAVATGDLSSPEEGREVVRNSVKPKEYEPAETDRWNDLLGTFISMQSGIETAF